jgi:hypothetical protein
MTRSRAAANTLLLAWPMLHRERRVTLVHATPQISKDQRPAFRHGVPLGDTEDRDRAIAAGEQGISIVLGDHAA